MFVGPFELCELPLGLKAQEARQPLKLSQEDLRQTPDLRAQTDLDGETSEQALSLIHI